MYIGIAPKVRIFWNFLWDGALFSYCWKFSIWLPILPFEIPLYYLYVTTQVHEQMEILWLRGFMLVAKHLWEPGLIIFRWGQIYS